MFSKLRQHSFFITSRPIKTLENFTQDDLVIPELLAGWPNGSFDEELSRMKADFWNSLLEEEIKKSIFFIEKFLLPWACYDMYKAIENQNILEQKKQFCEDFLAHIQGCMNQSRVYLP